MEFVFLYNDVIINVRLRYEIKCMYSMHELKEEWIYALVNIRYELKHKCTLNDKFKSIRFNKLEIDLSEVELIEEE